LKQLSTKIRAALSQKVGQETNSPSQE